MAERMANNLETFGGDINDYYSHYQRLVDHFGEMTDHMMALNNMWEGEAKEQFLQTFEADRQKTQKMLDDFKKTHEELLFAHNEYSDCETRVANLINQMPV